MKPALLAVGAAVLWLAACAHRPPTIPPVANVDLQRFMGHWYVIGNIPTRPERDAYNAVETYALAADGTIRTTFRYRDGGFDAPIETMRPTGSVREGTNNAVWGMQFVWPIEAEYVIVHLDDDYTETIVGRSKRDHAWIMARTPTMSDADYGRLSGKLRALGYSLDDLRRVPQQWPDVEGHGDADALP